MQLVLKIIYRIYCSNISEAILQSSAVGLSNWIWHCTCCFYKTLASDSSDLSLSIFTRQIFRIGTVHCGRPVTHAQTWASYSALHRFGRLSVRSPRSDHITYWFTYYQIADVTLSLSFFLNSGKSSESAQCAMLKACDACADMGQL